MLSEVLSGDRPRIREGGLEAGWYGVDYGEDIAAGVWEWSGRGLASVSVMGVWFGSG